MAEDNGLHGANQNMQEDQATTSTSLGLEIEAAAAASSSTNGGQLDIDQQKIGEKVKSNTKTVPLYKLFAFADSVDVALMIVGTIGAIGNGMCMPLMSVLLGEIINAFGKNQNNNDIIVHVISKVK